MPDARRSKYPEHDKMRAVKDRSQAIGDFIEWLHENDMSICVFDGYDNFHPTRKSIEQLLADHFDIDLKKVGEEKDAMVEEMRKEAADA